MKSKVSCKQLYNSFISNYVLNFLIKQTGMNIFSSPEPTDELIG